MKITNPKLDDLVRNLGREILHAKLDHFQKLACAITGSPARRARERSTLTHCNRQIAKLRDVLDKLEQEGRP